MITLIRRIERSRNSPNNAGAAGSPIIIEASLEESHTKAAEITRHPVEDGLDVTDFIRTGPVYVDMTVAFSNQPLCRPPTMDGIFAGNSQSRASAAWDAFLNLIDGRPRRDLFQISTGLKLYDNMALEGVATNQTVDNSDSLIIQARFVEVRIVQSTFISVPARLLRAGEAQQRGQGDVQQGEQHADDLPVCTACDALCEPCLRNNPSFTPGVDDMPEICEDNCEDEFFLDDGCVEDANDLFMQINDDRNAESEAAVRALCERIESAHVLDSAFLRRLPPDQRLLQ